MLFKFGYKKNIWLVGFLLLSVFAILAKESVPWSGQSVSNWGLDLANLSSYHQLDLVKSVYSVSGTDAHDIQSRNLIYPPLLFWHFYWLKWFTPRVSYLIWTMASLLTMGVGLIFWKDLRPSLASEKLGLIFFILLFLVQYPSLFALERGNNDVLVLLYWTLAYLNFRRKNYFFVGFFLGFVTTLKLYPAIGVLFLIGAMVCVAKSDRLILLRGLGGMVSGVVVPTLLLFEDSKLYFATVLPQWMQVKMNMPWLNHSVPSNMGPRQTAFYFFTLWSVWAWAGFKNIKRQPASIFAGALACSTFFSGVSFDYNLITVYPLLFYIGSGLFQRGPNSVVDAVLFVSGVVVIFVPRHWLPHSAFQHPLLTLQLIWLVCTGACMANRQVAFEPNQLI